MAMWQAPQPAQMNQGRPYGGAPGSLENDLYKRKLNYQKQRQYASDNMMYTRTGPDRSRDPSMMEQRQASGTGSSPVTATGGIAPGGAAAPAPAAAPATQPQTAPTATAPAYQAGTLGGGTTPGASAGLNNYGLPNRPASTDYTPGTLTQYGGGVNTGLEGTVQSALEAAIAGGGGLPVEQLKGRARDDALALQQNQSAQASDLMGARGRGGSPFADALQTDIRQQAMDELLGGYRDIDIEDALARNENLYRGVELGNDVLTGQQNRLQSDYQTRLLGEAGQEGLLQSGAENARANWLGELQGVLGHQGIEQQGNVARIGAETDKYGARMNLLGNLISIMERARSSDQDTGVRWGSILNSAALGI